MDLTNLYRVVLMLALVVVCHASTLYNVSFDELHKCKQHNAINGYNYRAFFKLHELQHHNLTDADLVVDLLVYVLAPRDAHILLSEQNKSATAAVEIVLGGGSNTFSQIRLGQKGSALKTKGSTGLLSPIDPLPVRVRIYTAGQIKIYAGNLTGEPFMETVMPNQNTSQFRYVSFTTWGTAMAKWFYDCPLPSNTTNGSALIDGNELEQEYDGKQRLLNHLTGAPRWIDPPVNFTGVEIQHMYVKGFVYDQTTNLIEISGSMGVSWVDARYSWNSSDYDGKIMVGDVCHMVWRPSFETLSLFTGSSIMCFITDHGFVGVEILEFSWVNFCPLADSYRWPFDVNTCKLQLLAASHERNVPISLTMGGIRFDPNYEQSEWSLKSFGKHEMQSSNTPFGQQPMLELHIEMTRKSDIHSSSIYPSYFVANLLICVSFLVHGRSRLLLNSLGLIILLNAFLSLSAIAPRAGVPKIYIFFQWSLVFYTISSILFVIDLWLKKTRAIISSNSWIGRVISFPALRYAFAMDQRSNYNTLEHKNIRWDEVTCILNRLMMVAVVIVFGVGFTKP